MASKEGKKEKRTRENRSVEASAGVISRVLQSYAGFCRGPPLFPSSDPIPVTLGALWI